MEEEVDEVELSPIKDLKTGDFILVKFVYSGKKSCRETEFRYVAVISKVINDKEFEIQCLKSSNLQKTRFTYIDNDLSIINIVDMLGKLPNPKLVQESRALITVFPGSVHTFEKN